LSEFYVYCKGGLASASFSQNQSHFVEPLPMMFSFPTAYMYFINRKIQTHFNQKPIPLSLFPDDANPRKSHRKKIPSVLCHVTLAVSIETGGD
jgi:hypothetical protein